VEETFQNGMNQTMAEQLMFQVLMVGGKTNVLKIEELREQSNPNEHG
jgi:hypothetical protein